jgi:MFS transporter, ACS family, tartrate transporter
MNVLGAQKDQAHYDDQLIAKVARRLIPFLAVCYFASYLDRVNLSFAATEMTRDLYFSPQVYGWGAGIFFLGYALLEPLSNYMLHLFGARIWISRIMVSWGIISGLAALTWNETSFYLLRFLLGAAEAGFMPGVILYLTYWIPPRQRGRILADFLFAVPLATVFGAPISSYLLIATEGLIGLRGWQWLFIFEAIPPILLGFSAFFFLMDRPRKALWLSAQERARLEDLTVDPREAEAKHSVLLILLNPRAVTLGAAYFGVVLALYGLSMWLPQMVESHGVSLASTGYVTAAPFIVGASVMYGWGRHSDWRGERIWHVVAAGLVATAGLIGAAVTPNFMLTMIALCFAAAGIFSVLPPFWAFVSDQFFGAEAAIAIALVNAIGNLAGFTGPYLVGWIRGGGGSYAQALIALALGPLLCATLMLIAKSQSKRAGD